MVGWMNGPMINLSNWWDLPETATGDECQIQAEYRSGRSRFRPTTNSRGCRPWLVEIKTDRALMTGTPQHSLHVTVPRSAVWRVACKFNHALKHYIWEMNVFYPTFFYFYNVFNVFNFFLNVFYIYDLHYVDKLQSAVRSGFMNSLYRPR